MLQRPSSPLSGAPSVPFVRSAVRQLQTQTVPKRANVPRLEGIHGSPTSDGPAVADKRDASPQSLQQLLMQVMPLGQRRQVFGLFASLERTLSIADLSAVFITYQQLLEPFTRTVLKLLGSDVFPVEFQLVQYLLAPSEVESASFLDVPFVAWPIHTLLQSWYFLLSARRYGWPALSQLFFGGEKRSASSGGLLGLGKGIFAMLAVSEAGENGEAVFPEKVAKYMRGAFAVGRSLHVHHALQRLAQVPATPAATSRTSLLVVNVSTPVLELLVDAVNSEGTACISTLQIARIITNRASVVCGHPADLTRLEILLGNFSTITGVKIHSDALPSTTPENSHFYNDAIVFDVMRGWAELCFSVDPATLVLPCHIPGEPQLSFGGSKIGSATNGSMAFRDPQLFMRYLAATVLCSTQSFLPALQDSIGACDTFVLDFNAARLNIGQLIAWSYSSADKSAGGAEEPSVGFATTVVSLPSDKLVSSVLPSPKRSSVPVAVRSTLQKCAVLNTLLGMVFMSGSGDEKDRALDRPPVSFARVSTSFASVGLVEPATGELTTYGMHFTRCLAEATSILFPPDILTRCTDVLSLLEMWEALEMTGRKCRPGNGQQLQQVIRAVGGPGVLVLSSGRMATM